MKQTGSGNSRETIYYTYWGLLFDDGTYNVMYIDNGWNNYDNYYISCCSHLEGDNYFAGTLLFLQFWLKAHYIFFYSYTEMVSRIDTIFLMFSSTKFCVFRPIHKK